MNNLVYFSNNIKTILISPLTAFVCHWTSQAFPRLTIPRCRSSIKKSSGPPIDFKVYSPIGAQVPTNSKSSSSYRKSSATFHTTHSGQLLIPNTPFSAISPSLTGVQDISSISPTVSNSTVPFQDGKSYSLQSIGF